MYGSPADEAHELLETAIPHLSHGASGVGAFEHWIDGRDETVPGVRAIMPEVARRALTTTRVELLCIAILALAEIGDESDISLIKPFLNHSDERVSQDAAACIKHIRYRMKSVEQLLDEVKDRESFLAFTHAFIEERQLAERMEHENPEAYPVEGPFGWANRSISTFLGAGLTYFDEKFDERPVETPPTWKDLAEFLYTGKIIE